MTPLFSARRRAEDFESLVSGGGDPARTQRSDAEMSELLELVGAMRRTEAPAARPEFVADLRAALMAEADEVLLPTDPADKLRLAPRRSRRDRRIAALVGGAVLVGATGSVAMASQGALPGETLYPVKRLVERAEAGASFSDDRRATRLLDQAEDRLNETERLTDRGDARAAAEVPDTLATFRSQAAEAADLLLAQAAASGNKAPVTTLRAFAVESLDRLVALEPRTDEAGRPAVLEAARLVMALDRRAEAQCTECGTGITALPQMLAAPEVEAPEVPTEEPGATDQPLAGEQQVPTDVPTLPGPEEIEDILTPPTGPGPQQPGEPGATDTATPGKNKTKGSPVKDLTGGLLGDDEQEGVVGGLVNDVTGLLDTTVTNLTEVLGLGGGQ